MNILIICFLLAIQVSAKLVCQVDQLVVELPDGNFTCVNCPKCPPGFGATVPCGGTAPYNVSVPCEPCMPGRYSDSLSSESCKICSQCLPDEAVMAKCTNISNTQCSCKPCPKGYYRNKTISKCLPCSGCCLDGKDEFVPECVSQEVPRAQTCSYQKGKSCGSKCWYDEITVVKGDGKYSCQPCPVCSKEHGLTVPCGSTVNDKKLVACQSPTLGKTFINQQGIIQPCTICSPGQEVTTNCSSKVDTKCGGCRQGFYYNYHSKSCQECFWCCNYIDSENVMKCIRDSMLFAKELAFLSSQFQLPLPVYTQSSHSYRKCFPLRLLKFDNFTCTTFLALIVIAFFYFALNYVLQRRKDCGNEVQNRDVTGTLDKIEGVPVLQETQSHITLQDAHDTSKDTKKLVSESPLHQDPGHLVFEKTGVEVIALERKKSITQHLPPDLALQAASNSALSGFLEEGETALSPAITFLLTTKLDRPLEVQIPHGANMVRSHKEWRIILKKVLNNKWVSVIQSGQGIKNFVPRSNHVSFETDHLTTFVVVGKPNKHSLPAFKRMKVAAFCSDTSTGEDLIVRLYCFDDCEYSFERLIRREQEDGGKLISSIESLDFSVTSQKDVEVTIKDIEGWQLDETSPMKLSFNFLRNSFNIIPQCNLVFHPATKPGKSSFFVVMALTHEPTSTTVMYASTTIKKDQLLPVTQNYLKEVHRDGGVKVKAGGPVEPKQVGSDKCIIQM